MGTQWFFKKNSNGILRGKISFGPWEEIGIQVRSILLLVRLDYAGTAVDLDGAAF